MEDIRLIVVNVVINLRDKNNSGNFLSSLATDFQSNSAPWGYAYISVRDIYNKYGLRYPLFWLKIKLFAYRIRSK
jgi:hypothetical protein